MTDTRSTVLARSVMTRLGTIPGVDVIDGGVLKTPTRAYVSFFSGGAVRREQRYGSPTARLYYTFGVMVVNNTPAGVRTLADRVTDMLDDRARDAPYGDGLYSVSDYDSGLITDGVEGDWRHSITCYFTARTTEEIP